MIGRQEGHMAEIHHRIGIRASQEQVHRSLTTTEGIASWWSRDTHGDATEGGKLLLEFGAPDRRIGLEVLEAAADRVTWRGLEGPEEWVGTTFTFELDHADGETVVLFTHAGWSEAGTFLAHCTTKWAFFLLGLKALLEDGVGTPAPGELQISTWG
jgi:uncharacterized protein YndB with AHSA1/START domain